MNEYKYQISDRIGDAILVVRSDILEEVVENIQTMKRMCFGANSAVEPVVVHFDENELPKAVVCDKHGDSFAEKSRFNGGMYCKKCWQEQKDKTKI